MPELQNKIINMIKKDVYSIKSLHMYSRSSHSVHSLTVRTQVRTNLIKFTVSHFQCAFEQNKSHLLVCLRHETKRRLVLNVGQRRFAVHFPWVLRRPHLGRADDVLLAELLLVGPGQGVTGQGRQPVIRVARGGRP